MKRIALVLMLTATFAVSSRQKVFAVLVANDQFQYNTGALLGNTNPSTNTNWLLAAQTVTSTTAINVVSGSLNPPPGNALPGGVGNSVAITGIGNSSGGANRLAFGQTSPSFNSGTIYYSFLLRVDSLSGSNNTTGGFLAGFNNTGNSATTTNPSTVGARLQGRIDPTSASKYDLGVFNNRNAAATGANWSGPLNVGDTQFIVGSYTFVTGTGNDISNLWVNPTSLGGTEPGGNLTDTVAGTDLASIASFILRQSPAPQFTLDTLRIGTDWASVTAVAIPEANGFMFGALASCLAASIFCVRKLQRRRLAS